MSTVSARWLIYVIIVLIPLAGVVGFFLPGSATIEHLAANHVRMALTLIMTVAFCGGALLFLAGLRGFKTDLRKAYILLASGIILFGLGLLQWPVIVLWDLVNSFWAASGLVIAPFVCATALMYLGMRKFALLLQVQSWLGSKAVGMLLVLNFALASGLLAHFFAPNPTVGAQTYTATVAWSTGFCVLAWLLVAKTRKVIGKDFQRPMAALFVSVGALTIGGFHEYVSSFFLTEESPYIHAGISLWPFIVTALLMVWAGYAFTAVGQDSKKRAPEVSKTVGTQAYIDSITGTAMLASRPGDVDIILDGLRAVTSSLDSQSELSASQKEKLVGVYLRLESYLLHNDPLRSFTKEELRSRIAPAMRQEVEHSTIVEQ